jgi:hypothetical protein
VEIFRRGENDVREWNKYFKFSKYNDIKNGELEKKFGWLGNEDELDDIYF